MSKRAAWPVDPKRLDALGVLLAFLRSKALTSRSPSRRFTPRTERQHGSPYGTVSSRWKERVRAIAATQGATVVGSLDPDRVGCQASNMRDFIHPDENLPEKIFRTSGQD